jgi:hypothetical protein
VGVGGGFNQAYNAHVEGMVKPCFEENIIMGQSMEGSLNEDLQVSLK